MRHQRKWPISVIVIAVSFSLATCGPSDKERRAKEEAQRKIAEQKMAEEEGHKNAEIAGKYNAVYFPPKDLGTGYYTYDVQNFFKKHANQAVVFKGYLEDIEETEQGIIVEFTYPAGILYSWDKARVRFKLIASDKTVKGILDRRNRDSLPDGSIHSLRRLTGYDDYVVVARMNSTRGFRLHKFSGSATGNEVEIDLEPSRCVVSVGDLIDAIPVPQDRKK